MNERRDLVILGGGLVGMTLAQLVPQARALKILNLVKQPARS